MSVAQRTENEGSTPLSSAKVCVACALTGGMTVPSQSPAIPLTPVEIVNSAVDAHRAGATIVHVHVRDPESGRPSADLGLFKEVIAGIGSACDVIVQPTTGGGVGMTIEERARVVSQCKPELATFNTGSFNFGLFQVAHRPGMDPWEVDYLEGTREYVFRNTFADMYSLAETFREAGTKPEFEAYDVGHLYNLHHLAEQGRVDSPLHIQFVLGVLGANAASVEQLLHMRRTARDLFGQDGFTWSVAGIGYPGEFHLAATALMSGGHVRVGLEDNLRVSLGKRAATNAELVDKAAVLAQLLDREVASSDETRAILGLAPRNRDGQVLAVDSASATGSSPDTAS